MEKKTSGMMNFAGVGVNFASPDIQAVKSLDDLDKLDLFKHLAVNQNVKDMAERSVLMNLGISTADINEQFQARAKAIQGKFEKEAKLIAESKVSKPTVTIETKPEVKEEEKETESD